MKRYLHLKSVATAVMMLALPLAGCGSDAGERNPQGEASVGWPQPPSVSNVAWNGNLAGLSGVAAPSARVVFSGERGEAYAVTADQEGHFKLWIEVPQSGLLLNPRVQVGQVGVEGQGVLFLASDPKPVAAILFSGEGAYRLDGNGPLDSVDSDGSAMIITGRKTSDRAISLNVGGQNIPVVANEDGRWAVVATSGSGPVNIVLDGVTYRFEVSAKQAEPRFHSESGWVIRRNVGGEAVQTTWLPEDK